MRAMLALALAVAAYVAGTEAATCNNRPNILFVLMDDLGYSDVGYNNYNYYTPTINYLAKNGIKMEGNFGPPNCSPSRHCLFGGLYPYRYGNQDNGISSNTKGHLPLDKKMLPQFLKDTYGYRTHMVGKWHQGFCNIKHVPTNRGFCSYMGFYLGKFDHYTHFGKKGAYDLRFNDRGKDCGGPAVMEESAPYDDTVRGKYSTEIFNDRAVQVVKQHHKWFKNEACKPPLFLLVSHAAVHGPNQVPQKYIDGTKCANIKDTPKEYNKKMKEYNGTKIKCGMMNAVDQGLRKIVNAMKVAGDWDNTLLVFTTDNGGSVTQGSVNCPLRGGKTTLWNGGIKAATFIYSKSSSILPYQQRSITSLFSMTDWYATLGGFAGKTTANVTGADDSINQWGVLTSDLKGKEDYSLRDEFVYLNEVQNNHSVMVTKDYKLICNQNRYNGWYHCTKRNNPNPQYPVPAPGQTYKEPKVAGGPECLLFRTKDWSEVNALDVSGAGKPQQPQMPTYPKKPEAPAMPDEVSKPSKPVKADYNLSPRPRKTDEAAFAAFLQRKESFLGDLKAYYPLLRQYTKYTRTVAARTRQYSIRLANYQARVAAIRAAYDEQLAQYNSAKQQYENDVAAFQAMRKRLDEQYWGQMWVETDTNKLVSNPETRGYTVPGHPDVYMWNYGWCEKVNGTWVETPLDK